MQVLITFIVFSIICFILTYYFNLFTSKTVYTRSELSNILPQLGNMINIIFNKYSIIYLTGFYVIPGIIGIFLLSIFENWLINSALLPLIFYYAAPRAAVYFEQTRVTISEDFSDIAEALYVKYYNIILAGFLSGYASKLIDNWINSGIITISWFTLNFLVITALMVLIFKNDIFE